MYIYIVTIRCLLEALEAIVQASPVGSDDQQGSDQGSDAARPGLPMGIILIVGVCYLHLQTLFYLLIFTSSHLHIFSLLPFCPLALLPSCPLLSPSFYFSLKARGSANEAPRNATLSHERRFDRQKLR